MSQSDPQPAQWSAIKKLLFCFFFIFFLLYIFLNSNNIVPYSWYLQNVYTPTYTKLAAWLSTDVLHIANPAVTFYNSTIDTVFGYLSILFIFSASLIGSLVWLVAGKKTTGYPKLYYALLLILRYYLAITWIAYGSIKITRLQFPPLSPVTLLQAYGNSSPKDLAWVFMGYSSVYNYCIGLTELAVGILLFFRRTSTFANLTGLVMFANVLAFDYIFQVNVKLLITVLMAMTLFLLSKDIVRLVNFFFLDKAVYPDADQPVRFNSKWKNTALGIAKYAFILFLIFFDLRGYFARARSFNARLKKPPLYGIYNVTSFIRNKDTLKPLTTDTSRWNKLVVSAPEGNAAVMLMNDSLTNFVFEADTVNHKITMYAKNDTAAKFAFNYSQTGTGLLLLRGKWRSDSLQIELRTYDMNKFPLLRERFRWIMGHNQGIKK